MRKTDFVKVFHRLEHTVESTVQAVIVGGRYQRDARLLCRHSKLLRGVKREQFFHIAGILTGERRLQIPYDKI